MTETSSPRPPIVDRRAFLTAAAAAAASIAGSPASAQSQGFPVGPEPARYPSGVWKVHDERFRKYMIGNTPLVREWTGALWAEGPAWNGVGRYVVFSDIPHNVQMRWDEATGKVTPLPQPVELFQRQHVRLAGPADLVRAPDRARRALRVSRRADGSRVDVRGQAPQRAERRHRASGRRRHPLHRPGIRQPLVLRGHRPPARAADQRLPHRRPERPADEADRRDQEAERALLLTRLPHALRRGHGADALPGREGEDPRVDGREQRRAASPTAASSRRWMRASTTASAPTSTAISGAAPASAARASTASTSMPPTASGSARS